MTKARTVQDIDRVIDAKMCVGCGACAVANPAEFGMRMDRSGNISAIRKIAVDTGEPGDRIDVSHVCPMSGTGKSEDQIAADIYPGLSSENNIGRYLDTFAIQVEEGAYRERGGSGGATNWLAVQLLKTGEVDAIVHVKPASAIDENNTLFSFALSRTPEEVMAGGKSRYYPIEFSGVINQVNSTNLRVAIVALPCFVKAVRLLVENGFVDKNKVRYCIGLVCGHLKSRYFAEYLAWQKDVEPGSLIAFDFRKKLSDRKASDYGFSLVHRLSDGTSSEERSWPMDSVSGKDWGEGLFKNFACEFCDDVMAECADVAIGDAWLPKFIDDYRGTNVVVVRDAQLLDHFRRGADQGQLRMDPLSVEEIAKSQASGLRHRREGLAHRLGTRIEAGLWIPIKRVKPQIVGDGPRAAIYDARLEIAEKSSLLMAAVLSEGLSIYEFRRRISPLIDKYRQAIARDRHRGGFGSIRILLGRVKRALTVRAK